MADGSEKDPSGPSGESKWRTGLKEIHDTVDWVSARWGEQIRGGPQKHRYWMHFVATGSGSLVVHVGIFLGGLWSQRAWSSLVQKALEWPIEGAAGFFVVVAFWGLIVATVTGGQFLRCFLRGISFPIYVYYFVSLWV